jgi:hypothetical protein
MTPIDTLRAWDAAKDARREDPDNDGLIKAELEAEIAHLRKVGVELQPHTWVSRILPAALVILMAGVFVLSILISVETGRTADKVASIQGENIMAQFETCERNNDSRVASIEEKRSDIRNTLRPQLALWQSVIEVQGIDPNTPDVVVDRFNEFLEKLQKGIESKQKGIRASIASQAEVAIRPGSPITNCAKLYPQAIHTG